MDRTENQHLKNLWKEAGERYEQMQKKAIEDYEKTHRHFWNVHRHRKLDSLSVKVTSVTDFQSQIDKQEAEFAKKRSKHHKVFEVMSALGPAVETIGGQAAGAGSMVTLTRPSAMVSSNGPSSQSQAFPPAPMIFSAVMFLFNAGKDVSRNYNALEQLFRYCNDSISDINQLVANRTDVPLEVQNVAIQALIAVLDVMRIAAERTEHGRIVDYFMIMAKPGEGGPEIAALGELKYIAKRLATKVNIDTNVRTGRIETKVTVAAMVGSNTYSEVLQIKAMISRRKGEEPGATAKPASKDAKQIIEDKARKDLRAFLNPDLTASDQITALLERTAPNTCLWLFNEPDFKKWELAADVPILWICGPSGAGKSHLAASTVKYFQPSRIPGDNSPIRTRAAAYFCQYKDLVSDTEERSLTKIEGQTNGTSEVVNNTVSNGSEIELFSKIGDAILEYPNIGETTAIRRILENLCWQLCQDDREYEADLADHLGALSEQAGETSKLTDVWKAFFGRKYLSDFQDGYITLVIDGLDNLTSRERISLFFLLRGIAQASKASREAKVKILLFSQSGPKREIERLFPDFHIPDIAIQEDKNRDDIEKFIEWSVKRSTKLSRALRDGSQRIATVKSLALATKGGFEMGALLLKQLAQKDHINLFSEILENPPKDITSILRQTVQHFGETHTDQDVKDFNTLLGWVLYSHQSPTLAQLNAIIGLESDQGEFLDIRDKVGREFSAYFTVVDPPKTVTRPQAIKDVNEPSQAGDNNLPDGIHKDGDLTSKGTGSMTLDADLAVSRVRLAHPSIANFFRNRDPILVGHPAKGLTIGMDKPEASIRLARICLRVICATNISPAAKDSSGMDQLLTYAANHFHIHLKDANFKDGFQYFSTLKENEEITRYLFRMFRDEAVMDRWVKRCQFSKIWNDPESADGTGNGTLQIISDWMMGENVNSTWTADESQWLSTPSPSLAEQFLKPIAVCFAKKWLQDPDPALNDEAAYFFIYLSALLKLFAFQGEGANEPEPGDPSDDAMQLSPNEIRKIAEWAGFEKTPLWYTRLGYAIGDIVLDDSKNDLREYTKAIELDPDFAQAHFALGAAYGMRDEYDLAIKEMNESRRCKFGGDHDQRAAVFIAEYQQALADTPEGTEAVLKTLDDVLDSYPDYFPAVAAHIRVATKAGRFKAAMTRLRKLGTRLPDLLRSIYVVDLHKPMRHAAQRAKGVGSLKRAYEIAITKSAALEKAGNSGAFETEFDDAPTNMTTQLLKAVAELYIEIEEEDTALKRYQTLLELAGPKDDLEVDARAAIAELTFRAAYNKDTSKEEQEANLQRLIQLEKEDHSKETGVLVPSKPFAGLFLGLYYRLQGKDDLARPLFKTRVEAAMTLLEDEDADNDYQGWYNLSQTLFKAGDKENAIAAIALFGEDLRQLMDKLNSDNEEEAKALETLALPENAKDEKSTANGGAVSTLVVPTEDGTNISGTTASNPGLNGASPVFPVNSEAAATPNPTLGLKPNGLSSAPATDTTLYPDAPWTLGNADCPCHRDLSSYKSGIWVCTFCADIFFCDDCFKQHREETIPYTICDSDHDFAYIMGYPKGLPTDKVKVGGRIEDRGEWREGIKRSWGISTGKGKVGEEVALEEVNEKVSRKDRFLEKLGVRS